MAHLRIWNVHRWTDIVVEVLVLDVAHHANNGRIGLVLSDLAAERILRRPKELLGKIEVHDCHFRRALCIGCRELASGKHGLSQHGEVARRDLFVLKARFLVFAEFVTLNLEVAEAGIS